MEVIQTNMLILLQVESLRQSGSFNALSTRLKQQKLYNEFPGIDQTVLDDIFHANW